MRSLLDLSDKVTSTKETDAILPLKLSWEERHTIHKCPQKHFSVSSWSCWQCSHWEMHSSYVNEITNVSGHCVFPREGSKESKDATALVFFKATGIQRDAVLQESKAKKRAKIEKKVASAEPKRKKVKGGLIQRKEYALALLKSENSKSKYVAAMKHHFPEISEAYINTLFYIAKKDLKEYRETDEVIQSKRSLKGDTGNKRKEKAIVILKADNSLSKDAFIKELQKTEITVSNGYGAVLFYQARTALGIKSTKKGKSKVSR